MKDWITVLVGWLQWLGTHKLFLLAVGGAVGTVARYKLSHWVNEKEWVPGFPLGTFVINVSGSFILGIAFVVIRQRLSPASQDWFLLVGTGFCGGYTTFSTFAYETFALVHDGSYGAALVNMVGSAVGGFVAVVLGIVLAQLLFPRS